jgi:two-component system, cell cycle response regulator
MTARVLVVDDVEFNLKLLDTKLKQDYYQVFTAVNGKDAIQKAKQCQPDIILMDVMMPEMDGFEATKIIKNDPELSYIPIIIVTALSAQEDRVRGLEAGADDFLVKPINEIALMSRLKSLVRLKLMNDELRLRDKTGMQFGLTEQNLGKRNKIEGSKILVVDDDQLQSKSIKTKLEVRKINVDVLENIEDLISGKNEIDYSLIITSTLLISDDGLRFCSVLRSIDRYRHTPILIIVDESDEKTLNRGFELGINDYLLCPIDANELMARTVTQIKRKNYQDELKEVYIESLQNSITDALTGLYNRRYFETHIRNMLAHSQFAPKSISVMMIDIDHFKNVNDTYGHQAGDAIIQEVGTRLKGNLRLTDLCARYGGEEFVIILPATNLDLAEKVGDRIRLAMESKMFKITVPPFEIKCMISVGVSCLGDNDNLDTLVARADKCLYKAKEGGRNKVITETML